MCVLLCVRESAAAHTLSPALRCPSICSTHSRSRSVIDPTSCSIASIAFSRDELEESNASGLGHWVIGSVVGSWLA